MSDLPDDVDSVTAFHTSDNVHFTEVVNWPVGQMFAVDVGAPGCERTVVTVHRKRRPLSVGDLAELLMGFEWGTQLNVIDYMKQFATWDALYDDIERREREKIIPKIRNVTPEKPKQLRETNE